jgi:DNA-binding NarL/FixJ family response regulator
MKDVRMLATIQELEESLLGGGLSATPRLVRVLVAASSSIARSGLEAVLKDAPDMVRIGTATLKQIRQDVTSLRPDVLLVLLEAAEVDTVAELDAGAIVVLTESLGSWAQPLLKLGTLGALPRHAEPPQIVAAIRAVHAGLVTLHPDLASGALSLPPASPRAVPGSFQALTPREVEVLRMLAEGLGNKIIADKLHISEHTVKFHLSSIFGKLNAGSRTEAVTMGARLGYVVI